MATPPSSAGTPRYTPDTHGQHGDARLTSEVFARVSPALVAGLAPLFGQMPGTVLEFGCGTGQNAAALARAFPALRWVATDIATDHLASAAAWAGDLRVAVETLLLDATDPWWQSDAVTALGPLSAVFAANITHIAPWSVTRGLLTGAAACLARGGLVILTGPFKVHGDWISAGNETFDANLRARDPRWGLRDTVDIEAEAKAHGLEFAALQALPANNRLLVLRKT